MMEYYTKLFSEAKRLTSYSNYDAILDDIMQHYPQDVRSLGYQWVARGCSSVGVLKNKKFGSGNEDEQNQQHYHSRH